MFKDKLYWTALLILITAIVGVLVVLNQDVCPPGDNYQIDHYEPAFKTNGQPTFKPVYMCK